MGKLTTHVLDTARGKPGDGVRIAVFRCPPGARTLLTEALTNADGRCDQPLLADAAFQPGTYEMDFHVGAYFARQGAALPDPPFLDVVTIRLGIADALAHYHVPLLVSPYAYSTYRGS